MENARQFVRELAERAPSDSLRRVAGRLEGAPAAEIIRFLWTVLAYCTHRYCEEVTAANLVMAELAAAGWSVYPQTERRE